MAHSSLGGRELFDNNFSLFMSFLREGTYNTNELSNMDLIESL